MRQSRDRDEEGTQANTDTAKTKQIFSISQGQSKRWSEPQKHTINPFGKQ